MYLRVKARTLLSISFVLLATGCAGGGGGGETPVPIQLKASAGARLNPDEYGNSLPTAVRVYQLKGTARLGSVELGSLLREPKESLGEDFLSFEEVFLEPKGSVEKAIGREKDARYVLVVGVFRRPTGEAWRTLFELPKPGKKSLVDVVLDEYRIAPR